MTSPQPNDTPRKSGQTGADTSQRWVEYQFGKHFVPVGEADPDPSRYRQAIDIELARTQSDLTESTEIQSAHKLLVQGMTLICIITVIVCSWLIWRGETDRREWATFETINSPPSLEIIP